MRRKENMDTLHGILSWHALNEEQCQMFPFILLADIWHSWTRIPALDPFMGKANYSIRSLTESPVIVTIPRHHWSEEEKLERQRKARLLSTNSTRVTLVTIAANTTVNKKSEKVMRRAAALQGKKVFSHPRCETVLMIRECGYHFFSSLSGKLNC